MRAATWNCSAPSRGRRSGRAEEERRGWPALCRPSASCFPVVLRCVLSIARRRSRNKEAPLPDEALFATIREKLFTAVIGDVMDAAGLTRQFLPPEIRALTPDAMVVGRAMTVLEADTELGTDEGFGLMFRALDDLKPGEVYICSGASPTYALWGGLMSARAMKLGATGAVLDGYHRDTREILSLGFPVFSSGAYAQDQRLRGKVLDFRCPLPPRHLTSSRRRSTR
ncbi:MAG: RraA family protein [Rhizobiales bacterium]|nr:RraA family protein [Hyphomicrobiales bacterium]